MILPSPMMTAEAQVGILEKKDCTLYIRDERMANVVDEVVSRKPGIRILTAPLLEDSLQDKVAAPFLCAKSWEEGKDDPWLVFHTSGTTRNPKPVTYTHKMMAIPDMAAKLAGDEETNIHHYAFKRWYTPVPMIHFVGMLMVLSMSTYLHNMIVLGPSSPPSPSTIVDILRYGKVDGALLAPALIDGLSSLRDRKYIHYAGAPLSLDSGKLLTTYTRLIPCIGSTKTGGYFLKPRPDTGDWDYIAFNRHADAEFEPRMDGLHELVFIKKPECAPMQQILLLYPELDRFETSDLWVEHPTRKGLWKIVGRTDDYVYLAHGDGLYASTMEKEIERHERVHAALIGGHGRARPMLLIELVPERQKEDEIKDLLQSLGPYLKKANAQRHDSVQLSPELILVAKPQKPLVRTMKGSVTRLASLKLYEKEVNELYINLQEN